MYCYFREYVDGVVFLYIVVVFDYDVVLVVLDCCVGLDIYIFVYDNIIGYSCLRVDESWFVDNGNEVFESVDYVVVELVVGKNKKRLFFCKEVVVLLLWRWWVIVF